MKNISKEIILVTDRLRLRMYELGDIQTAFEATKFEGFNDGIEWDKPANMILLKEHLTLCNLAWETNHGFSFSMIRKDDNEMVGRITIRAVKDQPSIWNIGFWTHPKHQRNGYMKEAVKSVIEFGFNTLDAKRIEADYATWNIGSAKVLEANEFKIVGFKEKGFLKKGKWVALVLVALSPQHSFAPSYSS